jgi:hypothetical protein
LGALEKYKAKTALAARSIAGRHEVKKAVMSAEIVGGALVGGILTQNMPTVMNIPTDAALGLLLVGVGIGMKQSDLGALGVGLLAGAAHEYGKTIDLGSIGSAE